MAAPFVVAPFRKRDFLIGIFGLVIVFYVVSNAPEPEPPAQEKVEDYRQRMIQIVNVTSDCQTESTYTEHFEDAGLAGKVLYNLTESSFVKKEYRGGVGFFDSRYPVYCPIEGDTQ